MRENVRESGRESLQRDNDRVTENSFSPLSLSLSLETRARRKNPPEGGREGCVISENFSRALFVREEGRERERENEKERAEREQREGERSIPREEEIEWICCPLSEEKKSKKNATLFLFLLLLLPHHFFFLNVR